MVAKKILLLLGHPDKSGFCGALADAYEAGAHEGGHTIERLNLGDMQFDPILHKGYREIQPLEPDLIKFQQLVAWADHFVIIYPVWWVGMPALLKGLFDRAWLPGSAFRYIKTKTGAHTIFWHRLFRGKTARTILASGTAPLLVRFLPGGSYGSPASAYAAHGLDHPNISPRQGEKGGYVTSGISEGEENDISRRRLERASTRPSISLRVVCVRARGGLLIPGHGSGVQRVQ